MLNSNNCATKSSTIKCNQAVYQNKSQILAKKCKNKEICDIKVNKDIFGSECDGDVRYVKVTYSCSRYFIDDKNQVVMGGSSVNQKSEEESDELLDNQAKEANEKNKSAQILSERKYRLFLYLSIIQLCSRILKLKFKRISLKNFSNLSSLL